MSKILQNKTERAEVIFRQFLEHDSLSIPQLAVITGFSLPVATDLVKEFVRKKLLIILPEKANSPSGRPPLLYELNPAAGIIIGIDLGRLKTTAVALNLKKEIICSITLDKSLLGDSEKNLSNVAEFVKNLIDKNELSKYPILGIGFSVPGYTNRERGTTGSYFTNTGNNFKTFLENALSIPLTVDNDVKSMTLAELRLGAARFSSNTLCINYGWGLGAGIITGGEIYYGGGFSGEFGHIPVQNNEKLCYCGKRGCLETIASGKYLLELAQEKLRAGGESLLLSDISIDSLTMKNIISAAQNGDIFSTEILEEAGKNLGKSIAVLINLFNPEKIVLGGGMTDIAEYLLSNIELNARKHSLTWLNKEVEFVVSHLREDASALGAAWAALAENLNSLVNL